MIGVLIFEMPESLGCVKIDGKHSKMKLCRVMFPLLFPVEAYDYVSNNLC